MDPTVLAHFSRKTQIAFQRRTTVITSVIQVGEIEAQKPSQWHCTGPSPDPTKIYRHTSFQVHRSPQGSSVGIHLLAVHLCGIKAHTTSAQILIRTNTSTWRVNQQLGYHKQYVKRTKKHFRIWLHNSHLICQSPVLSIWHLFQSTERMKEEWVFLKDFWRFAYLPAYNILCVNPSDHLRSWMGWKGRVFFVLNTMIS